MKETKLTQLLRSLTTKQRTKLMDMLGWSERTWYRYQGTPGSITAEAQPAPRRAKADDPFRCTTEDDWARQQERLSRIASATDAVTSDE